jgi:hypothetical protein
VRLCFVPQTVRYNMPMLKKKMLFIKRFAAIIDVSKVRV